jgi:pimeloyl-ACP methyl ester carboxylesterase
MSGGTGGTPVRARLMIERLDPVLRAVATTRTDLSAIDPIRESLDRRRHAAVADTDTAGIAICEEIAGESVPVRIYHGGPSPAPAVIYCHAGAFVLGNLDTDHRQCVELARRGRCSVVSVDYRLAPENPYPAALDDAITVLSWVSANAADLDVDVSRVAVAGSSAGAALGACLAQRAPAGRCRRSCCRCCTSRYSMIASRDRKQSREQRVESMPCPPANRSSCSHCRGGRCGEPFAAPKEGEHTQKCPKPWGLRDVCV